MQNSEATRELRKYCEGLLEVLDHQGGWDAFVEFRNFVVLHLKARSVRDNHIAQKSTEVHNIALDACAIRNMTTDQRFDWVLERFNLDKLNIQHVKVVAAILAYWNPI